MGLRNHWNTFFGQKFVHGDGSVTECCRGAASKCPHAQFLGQYVMDGSMIQIQITTDHSVKHRSDLTRALNLVTFSSVLDVQGLPE
jgi:hypothetical protein